jgi:hypothetical protein
MENFGSKLSKVFTNAVGVKRQPNVSSPRTRPCCNDRHYVTKDKRANAEVRVIVHNIVNHYSSDSSSEKSQSLKPGVAKAIFGGGYRYQ